MTGGIAVGSAGVATVLGRDGFNVREPLGLTVAGLYLVAATAALISILAFVAVLAEFLSRRS